MRILHISDLHASLAREDASPAPHGSGPGETYADVLSRCPARLAALERAVHAALTEGSLDVVVFTGDIADGPDAGATYDVVGRLLCHLLAHAGVPVVFTPGNHDDRAALRASWGEGVLTFGHARPEACPVDGPMLAVTRVATGALVSFDTSDPGAADGSWDDARLRWLEETLAELAGQAAPIAICTHHHVREAESDLRCSPLAIRLLAAARAAGAVVLCGHTHHAAMAIERGVRCLTAPALSFAADAELTSEGRRILRFRAQEGYALYDIAADGALSVALRVSEGARSLAEVPLG